jgi:hypothetical protein
MSKMTFFSLTIAFASPNAWLWRQENMFLAAQLSLAYMTSGVLRIQQPEWRNGKALLVVLRQHTYGNQICWKLGLRFPRGLQAVSVSVLAFECLFPAAVVLPPWLLVPVLAFGVAFHLANAAIIGLNTFVWAFLGLYPAFFWCASYLHSIIGQ